MTDAILDDPDIPFDQYQRYATVRELVAGIKQVRGLAAVSALDVGGYYRLASGLVHLPVSVALPEEKVVVLDVVPCSVPTYIRGSGLHLPFRDRAFDVVVSCDALEHVMAAERTQFLTELARVSRHYLIGSAPVANEATRIAERIVDEFYRLRFGVFLPQLIEHAEYGLPEADDVVGALEKAGLTCVTFPGEDLYGWLFMMLAKHYLASTPGADDLHALADHFYITNFPQGRRPANEASRCYRRFFVAARDRGDPFLSALRLGHAGPEAKRDSGCGRSPDALVALGLSQLLVSLAVGEQVAEWARRPAPGVPGPEDGRPPARQASSAGKERAREWRQRGEETGHPGLDEASMLGKSWFVLRREGPAALLHEARDYLRWRRVTSKVRG